MRAPPEPAGAEREDPAYASWRAAAAVLSAFDPSTIRPSLGTPETPRPLAQLIADSSLTYGADGSPRWSLRRDVRRRALREMDSDAIKRALRANPERLQDATQRVLEACLLGESPALEDLDDAELSALATVSDWLRGVAKIPTKNEIGARLQWTQLLQPFRALVGAKFHGRKAELAALRTYVGVLPPGGVLESLGRQVRELLDFHRKPPLVLWGIGGAGKSTLVAQFLLEHKEVAFVYLDFDHSHLDLREPLTLLAEVMWQMAAQFPEQRERCLAERTTMLGLAAEGGEDAPYALESLQSTPVERRRGIETIGQVLDEAGNAKRPFLLVLDSFEEVQYTAGHQLDELWALLDELRTVIPRLRVVVAGRAPAPGARNTDTIELGGFDDESAHAFLIGLGVEASLARQVVRQVGGNPLSLKLAALVLQKEVATAGGISDLVTRRGLLFAVRSEQVQAQLYKRILGHIHDEDVRKLAHPGLVLREITPGLVREVLAEPCGVVVATEARALELFELLAREVALVTIHFDGGERTLHHRADVRRVMLDLLRSDQPGKALDIGRRAVAYHSARGSVFDRAEEIYHRLCLGEPFHAASKRWVPGVEARLRSALDAVPLQVRAELASRLGVDLDARSREEASLGAWEQDTEKHVRELLQQGSENGLERALEHLQQRDDRLPASPLLGLEALVLERLDRQDEALRAAELALREYDPSDAAGALAACQILARLHERAGRYTDALRCIDETIRRARASNRPLEEVAALLGRARLLRATGASAEETLRAQAALTAVVRGAPDEDLRRRPRMFQLAAAELRSSDEESATRIEAVLGSSLGKHARQLSPALANELTDALVPAFPSRADLEELVASEMHERLARVVNTSASTSTMLHELVQWAGASGKISLLVEGAMRRHPEDARLRPLAAKLLADEQKGRQAVTKLTIEEQQELKHALIDAFPQPAIYDQIFFYATGTPLATVVAAAPLGALVFNLLAWLDANDKVPAFLTQARVMNPGNPVLRAFHDRYRAARGPQTLPSPPLSHRLRSDLVAALAAVPALHSEAERDRMLGDANTPELDRSPLDPRADLQLLADQLPPSTLAKLSETAATTVDSFSPTLARRLRSLATALRADFAEASPAVPLTAKPPKNPEALLFEGVDERKPRGFLLAAAATGRSVARLSVPRYFKDAPDGLSGFGTGWLIGADLMITNHHVIDARDHRFEAAARADDFKRQGAEVEVWFDYFKGPPGPSNARSAGLVASNLELDFAIFRLAEVPTKAERPPLPLFSTRPALHASDRLNIVQHGGGKEQTYAFRNNFFVEAEGSNLRYLTDSESGASGSPVLTDTWHVVALHHAAQPITPKTVSTLDLNGSRVVRFYNEGVFIDAILAWLKTNAPTVHAELTPA